MDQPLQPEPTIPFEIVRAAEQLQVYFQKQGIHDWQILGVQNRMPTDAVVDGVIAKFRQRSAAGFRKYGIGLERTDLTMRDWLNHAQQEAMDLANYLETLIRVNGYCEWENLGMGSYLSGCDTRLEFDGTMTRDKFEFCPYCGREIKEIPHGSKRA